MAAEDRSPGGWQQPIVWVSGFAVVLWGLVYGPLFLEPSHQDLALQSEEFFFQPNEAAGAPVLLLTAWLFYRRSHYRDVLNGPGRPLAGGLVLLLAVALYGWGQFTAARDLQLLSVIPLLLGAALALGGMAAVRAFWVPTLFLGFALPVPPVPLSAVIFPIQLVTADFAAEILNAIGVKSLVLGDQIRRPENTFIVIETCSGVRSIVTLTMLTVLLIDLFERRGLHAALLLLLAPIVAFFTNAVRVVTLVLNPHSSVHSIHNLQGIAMLLVGLVGMYFVDLLLEWALGSEGGGEAADDSQRSEAAPGAVASGGSRAQGAAGNRGQLAAVGALALSLLLMVGAGRSISPFAVPVGLGERVEALMERVYPESIVSTVPPDYQFRGSLRYLDHAHKILSFEGEPVELFLGIASEQVRQSTVLSKRSAWPASGWIAIEERFVELPGVDVPVRRILFERGGRRMLTYSFDLRSKGLWTEWLRQAAALDRSPWHRPEHMLSLRIAARVRRGGDDRIAEAESLIRRFWTGLAPELEGFAPLDPARTAL
jgi:exosortase